MFDHVGITVSERARSRAFYALLLDTLGHPAPTGDGAYDEWNDLALGAATHDRPVTSGLHVGLGARSRDEVDRFWATGTAAGYTSDGEPGPRPQYSDTYYGAFLLDPDGNSVEAVHHGGARTGDEVIDHLWIRVRELDASRRFWEAVALPLGLSVQERPARIQVVKGDRSFALVEGTPTRNLHLAFPADRDGVAAFHAAALAAGARDNGAPGERHYHPGYRAAFALDPDGTNVEAVDHGTYSG